MDDSNFSYSAGSPPSPIDDSLKVNPQLSPVGPKPPLLPNKKNSSKLLTAGIVLFLAVIGLGGAKLASQRLAPPKATEPCSCQGLSLYNVSNQPITADKITPGQTVRIGFKTAGSTIWKVRFKINESSWQETGSYLPAIGYYYDFPVPAGGGTFNVTANMCCAYTKGDIKQCSWQGQ